ncbi:MULTISPECIES: hypothetical protein [unclassified Halomonas]|uniref:hypothetical protein n=1 Tax=unclassified Halomonas TaxID=2609666 RepID=UPI002076AF3C|nr:MULTISPECIES: hypothetical protein [unclassified Halomonas]
MGTLKEKSDYTREALVRLRELVNESRVERGGDPFPLDAPLKEVVEAVQPGAPIESKLTTQQVNELLFSNGETGGHCVSMPVVNGIQVLWQDAAGTIPVLSPGDPIGLRVDTTGNGYDQWQDISSRRPIWRQDADGVGYIDTTDAGTWFNFTPINLDNGCMFIAGQQTGGSGQMTLLGGNTLGYIRLRSDSVFGKNDASSERFIAAPTPLGLNDAPALRVNINSGILRARRSDSTIEHYNTAPARSNGLANAQHLYIYGPSSGSYVTMHDYGIILREQQVDTALEQSVLNYLAGLRS